MDHQDTYQNDILNQILTKINIKIPLNTDEYTIERLFNDTWDIEAYKVPRNILVDSNGYPYSKLNMKLPILHRQGIYILTDDKQSGIYIGKGSIRADGSGVLGRVHDHTSLTAVNEKYYSSWDTAIIFISKYKTGDHFLAWDDNTISALESFLITNAIKEELNLWNSNKPSASGNIESTYSKLLKQIKIYYEAFKSDTKTSVIHFSEEEYNKYNKFNYLGEYKHSVPEIMTPIRVVKAMVDMLPDKVWNEKTKFIDPVCKNGEFLREIFDRLMAHKLLKEKYPNITIRALHILSEQIYGIALSDESKDNTIQTLSEGAFSNNIKVLPKGKFKNIINNNKLKEIIEGEFNSEMKFDVVIGNPPYKNGLELDFINNCNDICTEYMCFIIPAKWQTARNDARIESKTINYGSFRERYVKHISKVVYYPNCSDIFKISQVDGLSYILIDKINEHEKAEITNCCNHQSLMNNIAIRSINNRKSLNNLGQAVVDYLGSYKSFKFNLGEIKRSDRHKVWIRNNIQNERGIKGEYQAYGIISYSTKDASVISMPKLNRESPASTDVLIFTSNNEQECRNFISWLNTKFVRFFIFININSLTNVMDDDYFRFVPEPLINSEGNYDWSITYTDDVLFKHYNLYSPTAHTQDGIRYTDIINQIIKSRTD